jgi:hypothetical protein
MNSDLSSDSPTKRFENAVRNYVPKVAGKLPLLMPFKEGIAELRRKHASYETIVSIPQAYRSSIAMVV